MTEETAKPTRRTVLKAATVTATAGLTGIGTTTAFDGRAAGGIYSPYMGTWEDLVDGTLDRSTDRVIVSFIGDASRDGEVVPAWLANCQNRNCEEEPLETYADEIQTLQDEGIEVGLSIGGWQSPVLARDADDAAVLKNAYADLLDTVGVSHLDIDDENHQDPGRPDELLERRHEALAMLQAERPNLTIGYTVATTPSGIVEWGESPGRVFIPDAVEKGVDLDYVQPMTMHYENEPVNLETITSALEGTVDSLEADVYPEKSRDEIWSMVGVTPALSEITTDIATGLVDYAREKGMYSIAPWQLARDADGQFSDVFYEFEDDEPDPGEPVAELTADPTDPAVGEEIDLDATESTAPGEIVAFQWDFDDGTEFETEVGDIAYGYDEAGTYEITVTVVDDNDDTDSASVAVEVEEGDEDPDYPAWDPSTTYEPGDRVVHDGTAWEAELSSLNAEPSAGSPYWSEVDDDGDDPEHPEWDPMASYETGDRVTHGGDVWEATAPSVNAEPVADSPWWERVETA